MKMQASIIAILVCFMATAATAQTSNAPAPDCPAQHELIGGTLCLKIADGNIALPSPQVAAVRYSNANCRNGYEIRAANLCVRSKADDIVFAAETAIDATTGK